MFREVACYKRCSAKLIAQSGISTQLLPSVEAVTILEPQLTLTKRPGFLLHHSDTKAQYLALAVVLSAAYLFILAFTSSNVSFFAGGAIPLV